MSQVIGHTENASVFPVVHFYAGWWRVACMSERVPEGTRSTTIAEQVTCPDCRALQAHRTDENEVAK